MREASMRFNYTVKIWFIGPIGIRHPCCPWFCANWREVKKAIRLYGHKKNYQIQIQKFHPDHIPQPIG